MLKDLFVIRVFGGRKLRNKRLGDITPDDMMSVYKRQMLFVVVAIVGTFLLFAITLYSSKGHDSSRSKLAGNPEAYKYMSFSEYRLLPEVKPQVDNVTIRLEELGNMLGVPGQSVEDYNNILAEMNKCRLEYKRIRNQGGFE